MAQSVDPAKLNGERELRNLLANAERLKREDIVLACLDRLAEIRSKGAAPDPVSLDCWKAIYAAEEYATRKNGRTTRLARTRQKITRVGVIQTISDIAGAEKVQEGFELLRDGGRRNLTFEAITLKHSSFFTAEVRRVASKKLRDAGYSDAALPN